MINYNKIALEIIKVKFGAVSKSTLQSYVNYYTLEISDEKLLAEHKKWCS